MLKKSSLLIITFLLMLSIPNLCLAGDVDLNLSTSSTRAGNNVTASGMAAPETWVVIKIIDEDTNIIFFETTRTDKKGNYSFTFKVPSVPTGTTLTIVAGYGDKTASKDLLIKSTKHRNPFREIESPVDKSKAKKTDEKQVDEEIKEEPVTEINVELTIGKRTARINNKPHQLDTMPLIEADAQRTIVPLRFVGESLGAEVEWVSSTRQIVIRDTENVIILWIDSHDTVVNGKKIKMDCPPRILMHDRTFVPLRFVSEVLGAKVDWDDDTREIKITR